MDAYVSMSTRSDRIDVTFSPDLPSGPHVVLRLGEAGIHISPDLARKLAEDILAALPEVAEPLCPKCGMPQSRHTGGSIGPGDEWACYLDGCTPSDDDDMAVSA